jgi:hypothetical protein
MDSGDMVAAMGGFFLGQMFAGQTQAKPAFFHFVSVRVDRNADIMGVVNEVLLDAFLDLPADTKLFFNFDKGQLKVHKHQKDKGKQPLLLFGLCGMAWTKKDYFFTLGLRNEIGAPIEMNMALLRNLLAKLKAKKIEYEIW